MSGQNLKRPRTDIGSDLSPLKSPVDVCLGFNRRLLALNPDRFSVAHENSQFPYELRELLYGSGRRKTHRAVFLIVGNRVEVMAIRHVAQRDLTPDDL